MDKEKDEKIDRTDIAIGHIFAEKSPNCPKCGAPPKDHRVDNYSMMWHDGDVVCNKCNTRVRGYDAG